MTFCHTPLRYNFFRGGVSIISFGGSNRHRDLKIFVRGVGVGSHFDLEGGLHTTLCTTLPLSTFEAIVQDSMMF